MERREFIFTGRVQGVGFRATAEHLASGLPLSGWVRNEPDGTVRMEVQGCGADIRRLLERIEQSLPGKVQHVESRVISPVDPETRFRIIH